MNRTVHYASYVVNGIEVFGTAESVWDVGYLFREDGQTTVRRVLTHDANLMLYGQCDIADAQHARDMVAA